MIENKYYTPYLYNSRNGSWRKGSTVCTQYSNGMGKYPPNPAVDPSLMGTVRTPKYRSEGGERVLVLVREGKWRRWRIVSFSSHIASLSNPDGGPDQVSRISSRALNTLHCPHKWVRGRSGVEAGHTDGVFLMLKTCLVDEEWVLHWLFTWVEKTCKKKVFE